MTIAYVGLFITLVGLEMDFHRQLRIPKDQLEGLIDASESLLYLLNFQDNPHLQVFEAYILLEFSFLPV